MNGTGLRAAVALGALRLLRKAQFEELYGEMGVSEEDFALATGEAIWMARDRGRVRRVLEAVSAGVMDAVGVVRFALPAEYVAAVIVHVVHPCNMMLACRFMETNQTADTITGSSQEDGVIDPARVFTFVCELMAEEKDGHVEKSLDKSLKKAAEKAA